MDILAGTRLRDIKYNDIDVPGLSIIDGEKEVASGFIGEVLRKIPHLADREVRSTNYFFDMFVKRI
jgi:hypothetical protein